MFNSRTLFAVCLSVFPLIPSELFGFSFILQYEGNVDDRVVYFADDLVLNRTPPNQMFSGTEWRQITVTAVYENPKKPELAHMALQFQCPDIVAMDGGKINFNDIKNIVRAGDPVTFRINGPDESYTIRRSDLKPEPIAMTDWKTSSAPMLSKAGAIACNHIEIDHALHDAIKKDNSFDFDGFGKRIAKLGLPADMAVTGLSLNSEYIEFAWDQLWWEKVLAGKRPDPSGKWSTKLSKADREVALEKLKKEHQEFESRTASMRGNLLESIKKTNAEMKADLETAKNGDKHPDGSKMNKYEAKLAKVFRGQSEENVVEYMGNPEFNQAGNTRFLRYTQTWEKQGVTVYGAQGVIGGDAGGYAECFAEFSLKPDEQGVWRVNDIIVRSDYEGVGSREVRLLCNDVVRGK
ncbi:MAG: hypothetical protein AB7U44_07875 [Sulfuricurvum sp.]